MVVSQSDEYGGKTLKKIKSWSVVPGVFVQSDPLHDATGYDLLGDGFGLVDKSPERWQNLVKKLKQLNEESDEHTTYKLIYYARHGEGFHNRAESKYGTAAWDSHWAQKTGDGESVWGPDPLLTEKGIGQARTMNSALKKELEHGMPLPQKLYSSPFQRSATTLQITWEDILLNKGMVPKIKEKFRERVCDHTCDQRSPRSVIEKVYPGWTFDDGFTEADEIWDGKYEEDDAELTRRVLEGYSEVFADDPSSIISVTAHSGAISGFLRGVGHRRFQVQTGGWVPILLKVSER